MKKFCLLLSLAVCLGINPVGFAQETRKAGAKRTEHPHHSRR